MERIFKRKRIVTAAACAVSLIWGGLASAAIVNGDFSTNDFSGWTGDTFDNGLPITTPENFDASSGTAILTTDFDQGGEWAVSIFQTFTVQTLNAPGNTLMLDFDLSTSFDHGDDVLLAQLVETANLTNFIDLSSGAEPYDITSFAGLEVDLLFGLENNNGADDFMTVDNIVISQHDAQIPEPGTLLLLAAGLVTIRRKFI